MARAPDGARPPKSRLASVLPDARDRRRLYTAFLADTVRACRALDRLTLRVAWTPDGRTGGFDRAGITPDELLPQRGSDLGTRERGVFEDLFTAGVPAVVMVGSDLPTLPAGRMREAQSRLDGDPSEVVLGPADDGGYYLMALARSPGGVTVPDLFTGIRWSTPYTLDDTMAAATRTGRRVTLLERWHDVDDAAGLARLRGELATPEGAERAPATRAVIDELFNQRA